MLGSPLTPSDRRSLQVVSVVKETGELEISLNSAIVPQPRPDEVVLRVDAAPINPSDLILLLAGAAATGATIAGGKLPGQLLTCMEAALIRKATTYSRYGSTTHKQVYIYGGLDAGPTELVRSFGTAWGVGGWLMTPFMQSLEPAKVAALKHRIAAELPTTFASSHSKQVSPSEGLQLAALTSYAKRANGAQYLGLPNQRR